jgi:dimethylamine/trimethylamine dehydrogenase
MAGVEIVLSRALTEARPGEVDFTCVYTTRELTVAAEALVLVTARLPNDELAIELSEVQGAPGVQAIGDAHAPGTIASAVWDGHRYAEELDDPAVEDRDRVPFRREIIALAKD